MSSENPYQAPLAPPPNPINEFAPCPRCGSAVAKRVSYTMWGGFIGPKMLTHVKCSQCGMKYNGKTGRSNATAITLYLVISVAIGVAIGVSVVLMNAH